MADTISEEEFARWLTPKQARKLLSDQWADYTIKSTLAGKVGHGLLTARAEVMIVNVGSSSEKRLERVPVHQNPWSSDYPSRHAIFWENGRLDYEFGEAQWAVEVACHGIRFDPDAVQVLVETPAKPDSVYVDRPLLTAAGFVEAAKAVRDAEREAATPEAPLPATISPTEESDAEPVNRRGFSRLSDSLFADWHALFLRAYPNGNATQAWRSVNEMFPKHHIARTRVRELFDDVPVGRPRESKD
jgi:hypothetical protein